MCDCVAHRELVRCTCECDHTTDRLRQWRDRALRAEDRWHWLSSTRALQEDTYGYDFDGMSPEDRADYMILNHTAAVVELGEVMREIQWKPWVKPRGQCNREDAIGELVDVVHFVGNMLVALDCTDVEWEERYQVKRKINQRRQVDGSRE